MNFLYLFRNQRVNFNFYPPKLFNIWLFLIKLIKKRLRSQMSQQNLNHFMIFSAYPEIVVTKLDLKEIASEFVESRSGQENVFRKASIFMED